MKQLLLRLGLLGVFLLGAQPAVASNPVIVGEISGVEVCAQFLPCEAAVFTGTCDCNSFGCLCSMTSFRLLLPPQPFCAANGISLLCGAAFLVRSSTVQSSTMEIIRLQSPSDFVFKKVVMATSSVQDYSTTPSSADIRG